MPEGTIGTYAPTTTVVVAELAWVAGPSRRVAVTTWVPRLLKDRVRVATPLITVHFPRSFGPLRKRTIPVEVETTAVNVTF